MSRQELEKTLSDLHIELAKLLLAKVRSGTATAADLSVARQFLKDNNIDGTPVDGSPLLELARSVPFKTVDEGDFRH
jgi:hypothetical protein